MAVFKRGLSMACTIIVVADPEQLAAQAASLMETKLSEVMAAQGRCVLGLATGSSPVGLYKQLADRANAGRLDSSHWQSFNLDEYVGLPGKSPEERAAHPESYATFMENKLFGLLRRRPKATAVPPGHLIEVDRLRAELAEHPGDWTERGSSHGRAVVIAASPRSEYLRWLRSEVLDAWPAAIAAAGGIDLQLLGVGGRGHVAFHEAGIPFDVKGLMLVRLDQVTREHAVADGYFLSLDDTPEFALTMSIDLTFQARSVVVLASGERKREAIRRSLLEPPDEGMPMSYAQTYWRRGGEITFVLDPVAAADLLADAHRVADRGIRLIDRR